MSRLIPSEDGSSKSKDKTWVITQEDEGFNWNNYISKTESLVLLPEIIEEPEQIMEEVIVIEVYVSEDYYDSEASQKTISNSFKSIMPPDMFNSFAGFFGNKGNYCDLQCEEENNQPVEEIIDVMKEMNEENLTEIVENAMMAELKKGS
ncbi:hypothetical protein Hanom_Chr05g00425941 [Helianthus anomalus]